MVHEVLPMRAPAAADEDDAARCDAAEVHHRHTFTMWLTTENDVCLVDGLSPLYPLRLAHYPDKAE